VALADSAAAAVRDSAASPHRRAVCVTGGPPCRHTRYLDPAYPVLATRPIVESLEAGQTRERTTGRKKDFARPVTSSTVVAVRFRYARDAW